MKRVFGFLGAVLVAALMTGCCSSCRAYQKLQRPLTGCEWQLVQLNGKQVVPEAGCYQIYFSPEGEMTGTGSCNRLMASYTTNEKRALKIGPVAATRMLCRDGGREVEFTTMLERTTHYEMDGPMLMLLSDGSLVALFEAKADNEGK